MTSFPQTKTRTHKSGAPKGATKLYAEEVPEEIKKLPDNIPRSIVAKASKVGPRVTELIRDFRKMMNPYTATNLRERSYNRLKDYIAVADKLDVTHIFAISQTNKNIVLKIGKTPEGPTIHFRIKEYSLAQQIKALQVSSVQWTSSNLYPFIQSLIYLINYHCLLLFGNVSTLETPLR